MSNENGNMPAQPTPYMDQQNSTGELYCTNEGLTKREHFAAMAMQGLLSSTAIDSPKEFARGAVKAADALLAALSNKEGES